jgi:hypothetical protein
MLPEPEPIELPAPILAAAKKSPIISSLLGSWDPEETSAAKLEIDYVEALNLRRKLFPNMKHRSANVYGEDMEFPFPQSGGWRLALSFRHLWSPAWNGMVSAFLLGPGQPAPWEIEE